MLKKIMMIMVAVIFISAPGFANDGEGVQVGSVLPSDVVLEDQNSESKSFKDLMGKNGMVLFFYRSADWCPYCKAQLIDLRNNREKFEREGVSLVGVSYDNVETLTKFNTKYSPGYTLLSDDGSAVIKEFGIFDDSQREGSFSYGVAKPTVYVINRNGAVHAVLAEDSYKTRPQIDAIMDAVKASKTSF